MTTDIFKPAFEIIETIKKAGFKAYIVGGAVRDYLLAKEVNDIDLASSATPQQIQEIFKQVIPVGIEHGTVIVRYQKESYEVTTFRAEKGYSDFRRPDQVSFVDSITADLSRRDFTINAIAMTEDGRFVDPFNGQEDLENKMIRAVGDPVQRFTEDPLRMLRAIRFVSQLQFKLDPVTWHEIRNHAGLIEKLSIERVAIELEKLFQGDAVKSALNYFYEANLFGHLPIFKSNPSLIDHVSQIQQPIVELIDLFSYLTLMSNEKIAIHQWCKAYKLSNKVKYTGELLVHLVKLFQQENLTRSLIYQLPEVYDQRFISMVNRVLGQVIDLKKINEIRSQLPIKNRRDIKINGHDLQLLYPNKARGNWIRSYLELIEQKIIAGKLENDFEKIKEWILSCHPPEKN
ncbi:CCA tRNA nucleotidyltransferase [Amphibacillus indicireducens]|uniref:CCA-adding enzyme n=1 Tax=Amphibacillus indicireducens TaxID=1076330 RepID=A0ABP7VPJ3_9BACI